MTAAAFINKVGEQSVIPIGIRSAADRSESIMSPRSSIAMVVLMLVFVALATSTGCQKQANQGEPEAGTKLVTVDITGLT